MTIAILESYKGIGRQLYVQKNPNEIIEKFITIDSDFEDDMAVILGRLGYFIDDRNTIWYVIDDTELSKPKYNYTDEELYKCIVTKTIDRYH